MILEIVAVIVIGLVLFFVSIVNASCVQSVKRLLNVEELFEQVTAIDDVKFDSMISDSRKWGAENGFEFEGFFLLHAQDSGVPIKCASWWSNVYKTYFLVYVAEEGERVLVMHDFVTQFNNSGSLTTCTDINGLFLPRPKLDLCQHVSSSEFDEIKNIHFHSVKAVCDKQGIKVGKHKGDLIQLMSSSIKQQAEYTVSLPLWKYRGAYWYFIKKHILALRRY